MQAVNPIDLYLQSQVNPEVLVWSQPTRKDNQRVDPTPAPPAAGVLALAAFLKKR
jgi:hypothetical protein